MLNRFRDGQQSANDRTCIYLQRASIVEVNLVLNVEIGSPVANFSRTLKRHYLENGVIAIVVQ